VGGSNWIEAERARTRRPIDANEGSGLEAFGDELHRLRWTVARIHRPALAIRAQISVRQIEQIERAIRRTRRSTLERIVAALVSVEPDLGEPAALVARLTELAGIGLAPESEYRERVERRRRRRWRKKWVRGEWRTRGIAHANTYLRKRTELKDA
jgi:hypothetical protein